ncbi:hypothetical protein CYMTET_52108 [Cymbomonas tetramitiformis]|uniref:Uncharacterized protein n=1 Tax=Cymbomonas tetramitiformis TaxID=36881 RepID=A0AAE0ERN9_9CHLO|nr:hypothetical protein CYMTET_52108 [Cymbomonas tetramitiformis]
MDVVARINSAVKSFETGLQLLDSFRHTSNINDVQTLEILERAYVRTGGTLKLENRAKEVRRVKQQLEDLLRHSHDPKGSLHTGIFTNGSQEIEAWNIKMEEALVSLSAAKGGQGREVRGCAEALQAVAALILELGGMVRLGWVGSIGTTPRGTARGSHTLGAPRTSYRAGTGQGKGLASLLSSSPSPEGHPPLHRTPPEVKLMRVSSDASETITTASGTAKVGASAMYISPYVKDRFRRWMGTGSTAWSLVGDREHAGRETALTECSWKRGMWLAAGGRDTGNQEHRRSISVDMGQLQPGEEAGLPAVRVAAHPSWQRHRRRPSGGSKVTEIITALETKAAAPVAPAIAESETAGGPPAWTRLSRLWRGVPQIQRLLGGTHREEEAESVGEAASKPRAGGASETKVGSFVEKLERMNRDRLLRWSARLLSQSPADDAPQATPLGGGPAGGKAPPPAPRQRSYSEGDPEGEAGSSTRVDDLGAPDCGADAAVASPSLDGQAQGSSEAEAADPRESGMDGAGPRDFPLHAAPVAEGRVVEEALLEELLMCQAQLQEHEAMVKDAGRLQGVGDVTPLARGSRGSSTDNLLHVPEERVAVGAEAMEGSQEVSGHRRHLSDGNFGAMGLSPKGSERASVKGSEGGERP